MEKTCHPRLGVVSDKQMVQWTFVASSDHREDGGLRNIQAVLLFCQLSADKVQEFVAGALILEEDAAESRCGSDCIGLLYTS